MNAKGSHASVEIEIKARIDDTEAVHAELSRRYRHIRDFFKQDTYYLHKGTGKKIRIREDGDAVYVTFKKKTCVDSIEVNDECELIVESRNAAEALLEYAGFVFYYSKTKKGSLFTDENVTVELAQVGNLGLFLEIEYMADGNNPRDIARGKEMVLAILDDLSIPDSAVEPRYYSELILGS